MPDNATVGQVRSMYLPVLIVPYPLVGTGKTGSLSKIIAVCKTFMDGVLPIALICILI